MDKAKPVQPKRSAKVKTKAKAHVYDFGDFIRSQGIVALAIGFVVGTQAKQLVDVLTASFINPIVGLIMPGDGSLKGRELTITVFNEQAVFAWGVFILALINFIVVALVIYFLFKLFRLDKLDKKQ